MTQAAWWRLPWWCATFVTPVSQQHGNPWSCGKGASLLAMRVRRAPPPNHHPECEVQLHGCMRLDSYLAQYALPRGFCVAPMLVCALWRGVSG
jgi:hypothetical protein